MPANSPHDISTSNSYYAYRHQGFLEVFDRLAISTYCSFSQREWLFEHFLAVLTQEKQRHLDVSNFLVSNNFLGP